MSDEATTPPTPAQTVIEDLKRYGPELVEGGAEALGSVWSSLGTMPADKRAEEIERRMGSGLAARYKNPEHQVAKLPNGADPSPLRRALERHADQLMTGQVDVLASKLAGQAAGKTPGQVAAMVVRFLASREAEPHTNFRPEKPTHEQQTIDRLHQHFGGDLSYSGIEALARHSGRELARLDDRQFVKNVATALRSPLFASKYGGKTIEPSDGRLNPQAGPIEHRQTPAKVEPTRAPSGQFQQPPATKPRKPLAF